VTSRGIEPRSDAHKLAGFGALRASLGLGDLDAPSFAPFSDLSPHFPYRLDQGPFGACGGHAPSAWLTIAASIAGVDLGFRGPPSQRHIYGGARARENPGSGPLRDTGVQPIDPILTVNEIGIRPMDTLRPDGSIDLTLDGRLSDVTAENVALRPTAMELASSLRHTVAGAYLIDPVDPHFAELVAAALSGDAVTGRKPRPVVITMFVDAAFEAGTSVVSGAPNFKDPKGGSHYVVIVGHQVTSAGLVFLILNSWGPEWGVSPPGGGARGFVWVKRDRLVAATSEAFGVDISLKAAT
jgi:hypothetical protein